MQIKCAIYVLIAIDYITPMRNLPAHGSCLMNVALF